MSVPQEKQKIHRGRDSEIMFTLVIGGSGSGKSEYAENLLADYSGKKYYLATMLMDSEDAGRRVQRHRKAREGKGFCTIEMGWNIAALVEGVPELNDSAILLECLSNLVANEMFSSPPMNYMESSCLNEANSMKTAGTQTELSYQAEPIRQTEPGHQAELSFRSEPSYQTEPIRQTEKSQDKTDCNRDGAWIQERIRNCGSLTEKITKEVLAVAESAGECVVVTNNVFEDGIRYDDSTMAYLQVLAETNRRLAEKADRVIEVVVGIPNEIKNQITQMYECEDETKDM